MSTCEKNTVGTRLVEWCRGNALAFKSIGGGFAPRPVLSFSYVAVDDAFLIINHISQRKCRSERRRGKAFFTCKAFAFNLFTLGIRGWNLNK